MLHVSLPVEDQVKFQSDNNQSTPGDDLQETYVHPFHRHFDSYSELSSSRGQFSSKTSSSSSDVNDFLILLDDEIPNEEHDPLQTIPRFKTKLKLIQAIIQSLNKDPLIDFILLKNDEMINLVQIEYEKSKNEERVFFPSRAKMETAHYIATTILMTIEEIEKSSLLANDESTIHLEAYAELKNMLTEWLAKREKMEEWNDVRHLLVQIWIGIIRDAAWGVLTYTNRDIFNGELGVFWGPTFTESIFTLVPTLGACRYAMKWNPAFSDAQNNWVKKQVILTFASWSAIPIWNAAQWAGNWLGQQMGWSDTISGYFSGFTAGMAETLWQGAVVIPRMLGQAVEPIEVALNTLGGAVWQWIYQANLPATNTTSPTNSTGEDYHPYIVGLEIASGVATATLLMTLLAWKIKQYRKQNNSHEEDNLLHNEIRGIDPDLKKNIQLLIDANIGLFAKKDKTKALNIQMENTAPVTMLTVNL